jgi:hypothetical protein
MPNAATGYGQEQVKRRARAVGYDHHVVKPVGASSLVRCLPKSRKPPIRMFNRRRKAPSGQFGLTLPQWQ